jgi:TPR repeat protein
MLGTRGKRWLMAVLLLLVPVAALSLAPRAITLAPPPASAAVTALDTALAAYEAGDYRAARTQLKPLADRGSAVAETLLGVMAAKGQGGRADQAAAAGWWLRAANRGYAPAQLALAKALADGKGVTPDREAALVWAELAADGSTDAGPEARLFADALAKSFDKGELTAVEEARAGWRPWPG